MIYVVLIFMGLLILYFFFDRRYINKRIHNEAEIQDWMRNFNYELMKNRESFLDSKQLKELGDMDYKTQKKFEQSVPEGEGVVKVDFEKLV